MGDSAKVFGIDLGTTFSAISTLDDNGMPKIIRNEDLGSELLASAVYFPEGGDPVVGQEAKKMKDEEPERVVEFAKRYIGKPDAPAYEFDGVQYDPIKISALILKRIKDYADAQGYDVKDVVITCPAYFGNEERAATKQAGEVAGLNVLNIVNEPTAAAMNYCSREYNENRKMMVFDLGGGTFDITLFDFKVDENGEALIDIVKTGGNDRLGGIDWDDRMFDYMCELFEEETGTSKDDMSPEMISAIKSECEEAKKSLSQREDKTSTINCEGERNRITVTRDEFENRTRDLVEQTMDFVRKLLEDVSLTADDIDVVLLVGGSTRMPMIKNAVEEMFPGKVRVEDPDLAVAKGASLAAALEWNERVQAIAEGEEVVSGDAAGMSYQDEESSNLPTSAAAAAAAVINIPQQVSTVSDKLTRSMGPAVYFDPTDDNSYMVDNLLFVGDEIPAEVQRSYYTREDNQSAIEFKIFENVAEDREENRVTPSVDANGKEQFTDPSLKVKLIGNLILNLPPDTPKNSEIEVTFRSSASGIDITARNPATGETAETTIAFENTMTAEEVKKAREEIADVEIKGYI